MRSYLIITALCFAASLYAFECQMEAPGVTIERTAASEALWRAIPETAASWEARGDLAPLTDRCRDYLARAEIRTMRPDEWTAHGLCPCMPDGEELPECAHLAGICATGTITIFAGVPYVYLSDRESADGHVITVRHEIAHVLTACTGGSLYAHNDQRVWGAGGVVWDVQ